MKAARRFSQHQKHPSEVRPLSRFRGSTRNIGWSWTKQPPKWWTSVFEQVGLYKLRFPLPARKFLRGSHLPGSQRQQEGERGYAVEKRSRAVLRSCRNKYLPLISPYVREFCADQHPKFRLSSALCLSALPSPTDHLAEGI